MIARLELSLVSRSWWAALQHLFSVFHPSLGRCLSKVDLLSFVSSRVRVQENSFRLSVLNSPMLITRDPKGNLLFKLGLHLFMLASRGVGHAGVSTTFQNVLSIQCTLTKSSPSLGVVF